MSGSDAHMELKLLLHKNNNTLLFAEADNDFVNCLFSFLTLPLGTIVRVISTNPQSQALTVGCFNTLYESVKNLNKQHFCTEACKNMLLYPVSSTEEECLRLKINVDDKDSFANYFLCPNFNNKDLECNNLASLYKFTKCSCCGEMMKIIKSLQSSSYTSGARNGPAFVSNPPKFIITDDLQVLPVNLGTTIGFINKLGIQDMTVLQERSVTIGINELVELLKWILVSATPLTDLFLLKRKLPVGFMPKNLPLQMSQSFYRDRTITEMTVKVMMKKASKEVLFVEAQDDFVNFLFSFLTIPLGKMYHILDGLSGLGSIDGLYKSALALNSKCFMERNLKDALIKPMLPPYSTCEKSLFRLETDCERINRECINPKLQDHDAYEFGDGGFVKDQTVFIVMDNLAVTTFSTVSVMSILSKNNITLRDVEEKTVTLGKNEGINILKASLYSASALTNGLAKSLMK